MKVLSPQVLSFYVRTCRDQLSLEMFGSREMTSDETGGILLDRSCHPCAIESVRRHSYSRELTSPLSGRVLLDGS